MTERAPGNAVESGMAFRSSSDSSFRKPAHPAEDTHQEAAYLKALGEKQKPVRVKLLDGEVVRGWIEYYDRRMIRLTRDGAPNLFIYKHDIAYIAEEGVRRAIGESRRASRPAADDAITPGPADSAE
jgi:host factor-I protein